MLRLSIFRCSARLGTSTSPYRYSHRFRCAYSYSSNSCYSTTSSTTGKMALLGKPEKKHKVTIVGSGNWYAENSHELTRYSLDTH